MQRGHAQIAFQPRAETAILVGLPGPLVLEQAVHEEHQVLLALREGVGDIGHVTPVQPHGHADREWLVGAGHVVAPQPVDHRQDGPSGTGTTDRCTLSGRQLPQYFRDQSVCRSHAAVHCGRMRAMQTGHLGNDGRHLRLGTLGDRIVHFRDDVDDLPKTLTRQTSG